MNYISSLKSEPVNNILEIGRSNGYSFGFFRFCFPKSKVVSIDIVQKPMADKVAKLFDNNYLFIDGTSDKLTDISLKFDIAFIDGEHTYEWCKRDWDNIQAHLSDNAIIIFDDLDYGDGGVGTFFNSLKEKKFIHNVDSNPIYGVVYHNRFN